MAITSKINSKPSKSGKRTVYFVTVNGKRISNTNFTRKWEAEESYKILVKTLGVDKIKAWAEKK